MSPEDIVQEVFKRVRESDLRVADLYAYDGQLEEPFRLHQGREEIRGFYERVFREIRPLPEVQMLCENLPTVVAVLRVVSADGSVSQAADVFEVQDGMIRAMRICPRKVVS